MRYVSKHIKHNLFLENVSNISRLVANKISCTDKFIKRIDQSKSTSAETIVREFKCINGHRVKVYHPTPGYAGPFLAPSLYTQKV